MAANVPFPAPDYPRIPPPKRRANEPCGKEMKVLALGMPRTGTMSLYTALNELGYTSYHMTECWLNHRNNSLLDWNKAIDAKFFGKRKRFRGEDFDRMLWRYDAITDFPCIFFAEELMDAYPDAQIVLTTRDMGSWVPSMKRSLYAVLAMDRLRYLGVLDSTYLHPATTLIRSALSIWTGGNSHDMDSLMAGYAAHNALVRGAALVRGRRVLEFSVKEGWGPLCRFLGRDVPQREFPRVNAGMFIAGYHYLVFWRRVVEVGVPVLVVLLGCWVFWWVFWWVALPG
ncbi:hypothetical protein BJX76DRAFT_354274 [Aspergillus varians]